MKLPQEIREDENDIEEGGDGEDGHGRFRRGANPQQRRRRQQQPRPPGPPGPPPVGGARQPGQQPYPGISYKDLAAIVAEADRAIDQGGIGNFKQPVDY